MRAGNEIANHSYHHETDPEPRVDGGDELRPSVRRPASSRACSARRAARSTHEWSVTPASLGMTTVVWNVDPRDWSTPGTDAIYSRVVSATHPGSIILMHDGGGNR